MASEIVTPEPQPAAPSPGKGQPAGALCRQHPHLFSTILVILTPLMIIYAGSGG